jgi:deazaflavin-dependent oxidoreductase (nitroreductase family)
MTTSTENTDVGRMSEAAQEPDPRQITHIDREPGRLLAAINLFPKLIFKLHLGRLYGNRFAMVTHRGRKSGKPRTVILETADGSPESGRLVYIVAYGKRAQWYKNLRAAPAVSLEIRGRVHEQPRHEFLDREGTQRAIESYWRRYPRLARFLARNGVFFYPGPLLDHPDAPTAVVFYLD